MHFHNSHHVSWSALISKENSQLNLICNFIVLSSPSLSLPCQASPVSSDADDDHSDDNDFILCCLAIIMTMRRMIMVELHLYAVWWCSLQARGRSPPAAPPTSFPTLSCTPLHMIKHSSTLLHMINHSRTLLHIIKHSSTPLHMTVTVTVTSATSLLCSARRRAVRSMTGTRLHRQSTMFTHRPCTTLFVSSPTPSRTESDTFDQETSSCMKFSFDKKGFQKRSEGG